ncbi:hypothetical protein LR48_Vigan04g101400 [Vigna angularis]|uniref:Uncharacterized protein n=1 Tax=Phaseolus angularis TaxID=3914 RepID=A0A0L9UDM3_PHAAN|nr:hypothetical protein LR48_Vigan04g101400 [Vigna angularis]
MKQRKQEKDNKLTYSKQETDLLILMSLSREPITKLYPTLSSCFPFSPSSFCFAPSHPIVLPILSLSLLFHVSFPLPLPVPCVSWHCVARVHLLNLPYSGVRLFLPPVGWRCRQESGPSLLSGGCSLDVRVIVFVKGGSWETVASRYVRAAAADGLAWNNKPRGEVESGEDIFEEPVQVDSKLELPICLGEAQTSFDNLMHAELEKPLPDILAIIPGCSELLDEIFVVEHIKTPDILHDEFTYTLRKCAS